MSSDKKKIAFLPILTSGHLNVCSSIGSVILNNFGDRFEIYFVVDEPWAKYLAKIDSRFKFATFQYDKEENKERVDNVVKKLESTLKMDLFEKLDMIWSLFVNDDILLEVDAKSQEQIQKLKPDFLLCDQIWCMPAMLYGGCPFGYLISTNPLVLSIDGFPKFGYDCGVGETDKIRIYDKKFQVTRERYCADLYRFYERRGLKYEGHDYPIDFPVSDHMTIYSYPSELDYFSDELKAKYKLWQIDTPLFPEKVTKPYKLPEKFAALPGKIIFVSLGSLFSAYTHRLQELVDVLEKFPNYKYIVSKGPNGDKLVMPSERFIGENFVDQIGVLQVVAADGGAMITHGGNNTLGECVYFGVPCLVAPIIVDQINNASRIEETGFGFRMNIMDFTSDELAGKLEKLLTDKQLRKKWSDASLRVQKDNRILEVARRLCDYVEKL